MMGVPEEDRAEVRRQADLVVHREDGVYDVPPRRRWRPSLWLVGYYQDMVDQRRRAAERRPDQRADRGRDRRRPAHRRGRHRVPLPDGRGRQRDHHQAARPRALPPDPAPGPADEGLRRTRRPDAGATRGSRRRCATTPPASCWPATCSRTSSCTARVAPQGSKLLLCLGSANRDERVFSRPDDYDIFRDQDELAQILSFGGGRHFCLGANLARLEARDRADRARRAGPLGRGRPRRAACGCTRSTCAASPSLPMTVEVR